MGYKVFQTSEFKTNINKILSNQEKERLEKIMDQLEENGGNIGKPLAFPFFKEKRIQGKRIYFLVFEEIETILLVAASNKKNQQETIDKIKTLIPMFKEYVKNLI